MDAIEQAVNKIIPKIVAPDGSFSFKSGDTTFGPYGPGKCECGFDANHVGRCSE